MKTPKYKPESKELSDRELFEKLDPDFREIILRKRERKNEK